MRAAFAILVTLPFLMGARSAEITASGPVDPARPFLDQLRKHAEAKDTDFVKPLITATRAIAVATPTSELENKLRDYLKSTLIPYRGHFSKTGSPITKLGHDGLDLPKISVTGRDLEQLSTCTATNCQIKLTKKEAAQIEGTPVGPARVALFGDLLAERVRRWVTHNELAGYEERSVNQETLAHMVEAMGFMKSRYPETAKFLSALITRAIAPPKNLVTSFLRTDVVSIDSQRAQPILRITEDFELREGGALLFAEVPIYTNHYFDASLRLWEVFPLGDKSVIVVNDVMEIDELKKSSIIRALFHGKMEDGVSELEGQELQRFK